MVRMFLWFRILLCVVCALVAVSGAAIGEDPTIIQGTKNAKHSEKASKLRQLITRSEVVETNKTHSLRLSPNGMHLLFLESDDRLDSLWLQPLNFDVNAEAKQVFAGKVIQEAHWSADSTHIIILFENKVAIVPAKPDQRPSIIAKFDRRKEQAFFGVSPALDVGIIVHKRDFTASQFQLYEIDEKAQETLLYSGKDPILDYLYTKDPDTLLMRLAAIKLFKDNQKQIHYFDVKNSSSPVLRIDQDQMPVIACESHEPCHMAGIDTEAKTLYSIARLEHDTARLHKVLLNNEVKLTVQIVPENLEVAFNNLLQRFDASDVLMSESGKPDILVYETEYKAYIGLEESRRKQLKSINAFINDNSDYPQAQRFIDIQTSKTKDTWLVFDKSVGANNNPVYLFRFDDNYELAHAKRLSINSRNATNDGPTPKISKFVINYRVSDGMAQFAYVIAPAGEALDNLPLVVMPHGGPWGRDSGSRDLLAEFIVSRGYVVLQPNFRSSTGMGRLYTESANKDFGDGIVQQDIVDATNYALSQGIGDPEKLGIVGHSFGGFSVLAALSFTPELFHFGFAGAAPSDLTHAIQYLDRRDFRKRDNRRKLLFSKLAADIDDPTDIERLRAQSPHAHWSNINKPLYMWAGKNDDRVDIRHVNEYAANLWTSKQNVSILVDPRAGHSPRTPMQREAYLYILEFSLATHLGGDYEQTVSKKLAKFLRRNMRIDENAVLDSF